MFVNVVCYVCMSMYMFVCMYVDMCMYVYVYVKCLELFSRLGAISSLHYYYYYYCLQWKSGGVLCEGSDEDV